MNPKLVSSFHIVIVAPLLILLGLDKFPSAYKKWLVVLGIIVGVYHLYRLCNLMRVNEGMHNINRINHSETLTQDKPLVVNNLVIHQVRMFDSSPGYEFPILTIKQNDVVVWNNVGEVEHTVTEVNESFDSGYLKPGERFSVRFTEKGEFNYFSIPQEGWMVGKIVVI
jgi:plastocyanin